jgi:hypothetical protein
MHVVQWFLLFGGQSEICFFFAVDSFYFGFDFFCEVDEVVGDGAE